MVFHLQVAEGVSPSIGKSCNSWQTRRSMSCLFFLKQKTFEIGFGWVGESRKQEVFTSVLVLGEINYIYIYACFFESYFT